jgi:hypothetical protein
VECGARMRKTGYGRSDTRASACSISLRVSPASTDGEHEVPHPSSLDADGAAPSRLANDDPDGRVRHPPRLSVPLSSRPLARLQQADAVRADCNSERSTDPGHRHHGMSSAVGETRRMKAGLCWLDKNEGKYSCPRLLPLLNKGPTEYSTRYRVFIIVGGASIGMLDLWWERKWCFTLAGAPAAVNFALTSSSSSVGRGLPAPSPWPVGVRQATQAQQGSGGAPGSVIGRGGVQIVASRASGPWPLPFVSFPSHSSSWCCQPR